MNEKTTIDVPGGWIVRGPGGVNVLVIGATKVVLFPHVPDRCEPADPAQLPPEAAN